MKRSNRMLLTRIGLASQPIVVCALHDREDDLKEVFIRRFPHLFACKEIEAVEARCSLTTMPDIIISTIIRLPTFRKKTDYHGIAQET